MTLGRKLAEEAIEKDGGFRAAPAAPQDGAAVAADGGALARKKRPHYTAGQAIVDLLELRNRPITNKYQTTGDIQPGVYGSYIIRAGGDLSISLGRPPAVPADQVHPTGRFRDRKWLVSLLIYHAAPANITWPGNAIFGRSAYRLEAGTDENGAPIQNLIEETLQPMNPRPAGTADAFTMEYIERTGQWLVYPTHIGIALNDPETPDPNGTEEEMMGEEGEDGSGILDGLYRDENGNILTPEVPPARGGAVVSVKDDRLLISTDAGSSWRQLPIPFLADGRQGSFLTDAGFVLVSDNGNPYYSRDLTNWRIIEIEPKKLDDLDIVINGDFETGDLTGWETTAGDSPRVLDTTQPEQRPGSTYYLNRDWVIIGDGEFELSQEVVIPAGVERFEVFADMYAEEGSTAILRVSAEAPAVNNYNFDFSNQIAPGGPRLIGRKWLIANWATLANGQNVSLEAEVVATNIAQAQVSGVNGGFLVGEGAIVDILFTPSVQSPFTFNVGDIDQGGTLNGNTKAEYVEILSQNGEGTVFNPTRLVVEGKRFRSNQAGKNGVLDTANAFTLMVDPGPFILRFRSRQLGNGINRGNSGFTFFAAPLAVPADNTLVEEYTLIGGGEWVEGSVEVAGSTGPVSITLVGQGSPANVYFDNVRVSGVSVSPENTIAVAADLQARRHLILSRSTIYSTTDGNITRLGESPIQVGMDPITTASIAASADTILVSVNRRAAASLDNGQTFTNYDLPADITQSFATPAVIVNTASGAIYNLTPTGLVLKSTPPGGAGSHLEYDRRRKSWVSTSPAGAVYLSPDLVGWNLFARQPIKDPNPGPRKTLPLDVGRFLGHPTNSPDLFFVDQTTFKLSNPLKTPILRLQEIR